jgi:hypothetical protein
MCLLVPTGISARGVQLHRSAGLTATASPGSRAAGRFSRSAGKPRRRRDHGAGACREQQSRQLQGVVVEEQLRIRPKLDGQLRPLLAFRANYERILITDFSFAVGVDDLTEPVVFEEHLAWSYLDPSGEPHLLNGTKLACVLPAYVELLTRACNLDRPSRFDLKREEPLSLLRSSLQFHVLY